MNLSLGFRPARVGDHTRPFGSIERAVEVLATWPPGHYTLDAVLELDGMVVDFEASAVVDRGGDVHLMITAPTGVVAAETDD